MNCRKCGHSLNGKTVCPNCGTSIGYVVNNPAGVDLGPSNNSSNGYVQNNQPTGYVSNNNSFPFGGSASGFGWGVSEPSDGAFNKNYTEVKEPSVLNNDNNSNNDNSFPNLGINPAQQAFQTAQQNVGNVKQPVVGKKKVVKKKKSNVRTYTPLHKVPEMDDPNYGRYSSTNSPHPLVNFGTVPEVSAMGGNSINSTGADVVGDSDSVLSRAGTMSKDQLIEQMNNNLVDFTDDAFGMVMELPEEKNNKMTFVWVGAALLILVVILLGVYILPLFMDIGYKKYEKEDVVFKYSKEWHVEEDKVNKKTNFIYRDTPYKVIINGITSFSSLEFKVDDEKSKKILYEAFYDSWRKVEGGKLVGGLETFLPLEDNESLYTKIDYELDEEKGVGAFYVVVNEKYDVVITFMSYFLEKDREKIEEEILKLLDGIYYVGETALEKEQSKYSNFSAGKVSSYKAGDLLEYDMPECFQYDEQRTAALQYQYNIFQFKDKQSLVEVKAYKGGYTYESMKDSAITNYGAIQNEKKISINGKIWYMMVTPEYKSNGVGYHNEIYFTFPSTNNAIYYLQAYVSTETSLDSYKKAYFDKGIEYILENMTLKAVH